MKIAALWQRLFHFGLHEKLRMGGDIGLGAQILWPLDFIGARQRRQTGAAAGQQTEQRRQILHLLGDDVDDAGFVLQLAGDGDEARADARRRGSARRPSARR